MCEELTKEDFIDACYICGRVADIDELTYTSKGYVCQNCLDDNFDCCSICGSWEDLDELTDTVDGCVCKSCLQDYIYCSERGEYYNKYDPRL